MISAIVDFLGKQPSSVVFNVALALIAVILAVGVIYYDFTRLARIKSDLKKFQIYLMTIKAGNYAEWPPLRVPAVKTAWDNCCRQNPDDSVASVSKIQSQFEQTRIIGAYANRQAAEHVPGIIVGVGLTAAVIGYLLAFCQIVSTRIAINSDSARAILTAILPDAILIIVIAIIAALLFVLIDRFYLNSVRKSLTERQNTIASNFEVIEDSDMLRKIMTDSQKLAKAASSMGDQVANKISKVIQSEIVPAIAKEFRDSQTDQLKPAITAMSATIEKFCTESISTQQNGVKKMAQAFAERLEKNFKDFSDQMTSQIETLANLQKTSVESSTAYLEALNKSTETQTAFNADTKQSAERLTQCRIQLTDTSSLLEASAQRVQDLADTIRTVLDTEKQEALKLREERDGVLEINTEYFDTMGKQIQMLQENFQTNIESVFAKFTEIYTSTIAKIDESTRGMMASFNENSQGAMTNMDEQISKIGFASREIGSNMTALTEALQKSVRGLAEQMQSSSERTFAVFDENLGQISAQLIKTTNVIRDSVDDLPAAVMAVRGYLTEHGTDNNANRDEKNY